MIKSLNMFNEILRYALFQTVSVNRTAFYSKPLTAVNMPTVEPLNAL